MKNIASMIDHTLLKPEASDSAIEKLCTEAKQYHFASVCVNPSKVELASKLLSGTDVAVCTVIGFPLGATTSLTKAFETAVAIKNGATEIDMVINIGDAKDGKWDKVEKDIQSVVESAKNNYAEKHGKSEKAVLVKVILETCYLTEKEIVKACKVAKKAGADFVKTSTGFGPEGAKADIVKLMKKTVGKTMQVKAAGGIRDKKTALQMIEAGASRIGSSNGPALL
jgi:deoxyribose-phosphate aldolase